ncbi:hypothetical protein GUJ93_ZPchr0010g9154 [Zizania palustris]|uniref:Uncharacterized protein n=1 Tax=Zizania palustris TaxID=103762 RepID=A0A8J5WGP8_ZIZPA|nr:hypothetical protein GUJ93_ZPchr0010g9154 [Zizania palustris]
MQGESITKILYASSSPSPPLPPPPSGDPCCWFRCSILTIKSGSKTDRAVLSDRQLVKRSETDGKFELTELLLAEAERHGDGGPVIAASPARIRSGSR